MCELFGVSSKNPLYINEELKEFFSHSVKHPHGWGLASVDSNLVNIEKEPAQAVKSYYLKNRLTIPIKNRIALGHIRYATIGNVEYKNCHPYSIEDGYNKRWTFIHNGTIFSYPKLDQYVNTQQGSTDSERILMYIIDQINSQKEQLDKKEFFSLLDKITVDMSKGNKLNYILTDGDIVYVHTNYANSLHYLDKDGSVLFSTRPLSKENWQPVTMTTLLAYKDGELLYTGTNHHHEYFDNKENTKHLYQVFSDL